MNGLRGQSSRVLAGARRRVQRSTARYQRKNRAWYGVTLDEARRSPDSASELGEMFFAHEGREVHKFIHYFPVYERHLAAFRSGFVRSDGVRHPLRLLEIGVNQGGSLQLWRNYFGKESVIYGIDVNPKCRAIDDPDLCIRIGSQADPEFLQSVVGEMGGVDVVLDDGSHRAEHQAASFAVLFPMLSEGGLYLVEDTHTAYWRDFGGGLKKRSSFVELAKDLVDGMHAWYYPQRPPKRGVMAKSAISAVTFHDSIVAIEKHAHTQPMVARNGSKSF